MRVFLEGTNPGTVSVHVPDPIVSFRVFEFEDAKAEAAKALALNPSDPIMLYSAACFYARLSEKRLAIDALKNAFSAGYMDYEWAKSDPDLVNIRTEPEYIELMNGK